VPEEPDEEAITGAHELIYLNMSPGEFAAHLRAKANEKT
jgi:hypothetical protein